MNRFALVAFSLLATLTAAAQQPTAPDPSQKVAAVINGEVITKGKLDALYAAIPAPTRVQYDQAGGKKAFLDNYVAKRLLIQEALKSGFDQRPHVKVAMEAARESALFDRYIREVVAAGVITDAEVRKYYDDHPTDFSTPERAKVRHIVFSWKQRSKEEGRRLAEQVLSELLPFRLAAAPDTAGARQVFVSRFSEAARKYSEDGVAEQGGDLGWVSRGQLDKNFEEAAFGMKRGTMSGIIETQFGYHLILVEEKEDAGIEPFESVRNDVREFLVGQKTTEVMASVKQLTNELRKNSKVAIYAENVD